ncbi:hypothetical protein ACQR16_27595 [Bradyrhizobium oligotrophicum]|uniref:hypothetical protein n=1 Tax=Bradyrhizobium oligotrophicum TaxID=44255 RepID=UPI003EBA3A2D
MRDRARIPSRPLGLPITIHLPKSVHRPRILTNFGTLAVAANPIDRAAFDLNLLIRHEQGQGRQVGGTSNAILAEVSWAAAPFAESREAANVGAGTCVVALVVRQALMIGAPSEGRSFYYQGAMRRLFVLFADLDRSPMKLRLNDERLILEQRSEVDLCRGAVIAAFHATSIGSSTLRHLSSRAFDEVSLQTNKRLHLIVRRPLRARSAGLTLRICRGGTRAAPILVTGRWRRSVR